jgi:hypothetical protein
VKIGLDVVNCGYVTNVRNGDSKIGKIYFNSAVLIFLDLKQYKSKPAMLLLNNG